MKYVDGFVIPIPKKNLPAYRRMARVAAKVWRDAGALEYRECVGDDLQVPFGMPFPKQLKLKPGETVVFAWIVFKSRAHRDRVNKTAMADKRIEDSCDPAKMPFDARRMLCGGFNVMVEF